MKDHELSPVSEESGFVELPQLPALQIHRTATIHVGSAIMDLPENLSDGMLLRIIKAVAHAQ